MFNYILRLSEVAGSKLTTNNPAITDLSDENRPLKLSEKFGQLYDDEWTDSLEEILSNGLDEVASVAFLLRVVMVGVHVLPQYFHGTCSCIISSSVFFNGSCIFSSSVLLW